MSENREKFEKFLIKLDENELAKLLKSKEYEQYRSIIQERIKTFYNILAKIKITDDYVELKNIQKSLKIGDYLHKILIEKIHEIVKDEIKNADIKKFLMIRNDYKYDEETKPLLKQREIELFGHEGITKDNNDEFDKIYEDDNKIDNEINKIKQRIKEIKENLIKYKSVNTINLYL